MKKPSLNRHEKATGIDIFDKSNKRSVYNLVTDAMRDKIDRLEPADFNITERRLRNKLKPDRRDLQLRISFWNEYYVAQDANRKMMMRRIIDGICGDDYFYNTFLFDKNRLIYLLMPISNYKKAMDEMFYSVTDKLREVIDLPIITEGKEGEKVVDHRLINSFLKIHKRLEDRIMGSVVQNLKIDQTQKNLNLNLSATAEAPKNLDDVEAEIKLLEAEIQKKRASTDVPDNVPLPVDENTLAAEIVEADEVRLDG